MQGSGVLTMLNAEAQEQEIKEVFLAYAFLLQGPKSPEELDNDVERFMLTYLKESVDFEVQDAVRKVVQLGLAE
eukprot:gene21013-7859_t